MVPSCLGRDLCNSQVASRTPAWTSGPASRERARARQPGACAHKEGWSGRSGPVSASGPGGGSSPWWGPAGTGSPSALDALLGRLGRSGATGARAGQAGEGFPTAKARRPVTSLARPQA